MWDPPAINLEFGERLTLDGLGAHGDAVESDDHGQRGKNEDRKNRGAGQCAAIERQDDWPGRLAPGPACSLFMCVPP